MIYEDRKVNIFQGLVVKNYKEMCKLLNEPVTNGNSKKRKRKTGNVIFLLQSKGRDTLLQKCMQNLFPLMMLVSVKKASILSI